MYFLLLFRSFSKSFHGFGIEEVHESHECLSRALIGSNYHEKSHEHLNGKPVIYQNDLNGGSIMGATENKCENVSEEQPVEPESVTDTDLYDKKQTIMENMLEEFNVLQNIIETAEDTSYIEQTADDEKNLTGKASVTKLIKLYELNIIL